MILVTEDGGCDMVDPKIDTISERIGPLYTSEKPAEITMYSYERPARIFWRGFIEGLANKGWTEQEIIEWLESKAARWMLDGMDTELFDLGFTTAKDQEKLEEIFGG